MDSFLLSVRISSNLLDKLRSQIDQQGLTVTEGVLAAIASYIGDNERLPLVERVSRVEQRLAVLENNILIP